MDSDQNMAEMIEDAEMIDDENEIESNSLSDDDDDDDDQQSEKHSKKKIPKKVYLPGKPLEDGEELVCDESAYVMLHQAHTGAPCLSFDIIEDGFGDNREQFPLTSYIVAGTQAARTHVNNVIVMKMHNLHRTSKERDHDDNDDDDDNSSDEDDSDDDSENKKPKMSCALIKHQGCVNRIRSRRIKNSVFAGAWSELGSVSIWKLDDELQAIEDPVLLKEYEKKSYAKPVFTFNGHQKEGFAIDWSSVVPGVLATGDCKRDIHVWKPLEDGTWSIDQRPLIGHTESVEDLQWSPNEHSVLASCSVDKSIRIWDCRASPQKACMLTCDNSHQSDVNVISWNKNEPFIVSGGDDGFIHIWDLRQFQSKKSIASFKHHTSHVTTVEWYPKDSTILASGGADDQIAIWDLAVEKDSSSTQQNLNGDDNDDELNNLPPQLLFIHQGQQDIKELHWHPQLPGVILSTAHSGFNVFRTISV